MPFSPAAAWPDDPDAGWFDDDRPDAESDDDPDEELLVEIAFNTDGTRLACVYTRGLWQQGIPELYISPPPGFRPLAHEASALVLFLASGLIRLGQALIDADDFELPPQEGTFEGRTASLWLAGQEPPQGVLAIAVGDGVDTVTRVDCSLWKSSARVRANPRSASSGPAECD